MPAPAIAAVLARLAAVGGSEAFGTSAAARVSSSIAEASKANNVWQAGKSAFMNWEKTGVEALKNQWKASKAAGEDPIKVHENKTQYLDAKERFNQLTSNADKISQSFGKVGEASMTVARKFYEIPKGITDFAQAQLDSQESLRRYSNRISAAFAQLEGGRVQRSIDTAQSTEGTTQMLASAINDLEQTLQPMLAVMINTLNVIAATGAKGVDLAVRFGTTFGLFADAYNRFKKNGQPEWQKTLTELAAAGEEKRKKFKH